MQFLLNKIKEASRLEGRKAFFRGTTLIDVRKISHTHSF